MIFIGGVPYPSSSSSSSQPSNSNTLVAALMEHPTLVSASQSFNKSTQQQQTRVPKFVYVFQREYATVDPALVQYIGTDEATTCIGLVIRNHKNGMISVAHMDSPKVVDIGLTQMLSLVVNHDSDAAAADLDVHLVGGFEDHDDRSRTADGYSLPLCAKIVETLHKRQEKFHIRTLCVLGHNTKRDSQGNAYPIVNGFLVETSTGSIRPASYDKSSRCPDEIVRRLRVCAAYEDPSWKGKLLETYDTLTDRFIIAPCCWTVRLVLYVLSLQNLSDTEILSNCSTSPYAEGPDFVDNERRLWDYLIKHPDWRETFPMKQARVFERDAAEGGWKQAAAAASLAL